MIRSPYYVDYDEHCIKLAEPNPIKETTKEWQQGNQSFQCVQWKEKFSRDCSQYGWS